MEEDTLIIEDLDNCKNETERKIKYKEDMIERIKESLEIALERTNNISLEDKEFSIMIYCNNKDRIVGTSFDDRMLNFMINGE